jgi:hypothetical protein
MPVPLIAPATGALEAEQLEDLLHGDFRTDAVEVDAWHNGSSLGVGGSWLKQKKNRSVPTIYIGNAERSFSHSGNTLPACRRAADLTGAF